MARILVVDDHELVRKGICTVLAKEPSLTICGEAVDGRDAVQKATVLRPDVVVMDISMPRLNGLDATREIHRLLPNTKIIIVSQHEAAEMKRLAFTAGASAYVVKSAISGNLLAAISELNEHKSFVMEPIHTPDPHHVDVRDINQRSAALESAFRGSAEHLSPAMTSMGVDIYRAIGDSIDYGVWVCDAEGRNIYASPSFLELTGLTQQESSNFGWTELLHPDDVQATVDAWRECVRNGTVWEREHRYRRADGGWHHILARGVPIRDDQGKILYWAGINLDIQLRKEAEIALEERVNERTRELLNARNDLRELSGRLLKTQDEERRRIARELHDGVGQLLSGLKMNFAGIVKEKSKLSAQTAKSVDENEDLIDQALEDLRTMSYLLHPPLLDEIGLGSALQWYLDGFASRSKIDATLDMASDFGKLPRELELSLFRIVQECLTNIHRHSGSRTARVRLYRMGREVRLEVKDQGKGMPASVLSKVSAGESFGVGFRGIRERLRQFDGRLEIQSNKSGTVVSAFLPDDSATTPEDEFDLDSGRTREETTSPAVGDSDAATILCIDDEVTGLFTRRLLLESAGHRVIEARSGPEGIRIFQSEKIDAVILDYWMSGMKGTVVAAELKALNPSVPIIVLSGLPDFPGEATGVVDEWLLKGSNRAERLLETIKAVLERRPV